MEKYFFTFSSWFPPDDRAQSSRQDFEPSENQELGRCGKNSEGDPEPEAVPSSPYHQAIPGHLHAHGHIHGYGVRVRGRTL